MKTSRKNDDDDDIDLDAEGFDAFMAESDSDDSLTNVQPSRARPPLPVSSAVRNITSADVKSNRFVRDLKEKAAAQRTNAVKVQQEQKKQEELVIKKIEREKEELQQPQQQKAHLLDDDNDEGEDDSETLHNKDLFIDPSEAIHQFTDTGHFSMRLSDSDPTLTMRQRQWREKKGIYNNEDDTIYNDISPSEYSSKMTESRLDSLLYQEEKEEEDKRKFFDNLNKKKEQSIADSTDFDDFEDYLNHDEEIGEDLTRTVGKPKPKAVIDEITDADLEEFAKSRDKRVVDREQWNRMTTQNVSLSTQVVNLEMGATAKKEENQRLAAECDALRQENKQLKEQLSDLREEFTRVSNELDEVRHRYETELMAHQEDNEKHETRLQLAHSQNVAQHDIDIKSYALTTDMKKEYEDRVERYKVERKTFEQRMYDALQKADESRKQILLLQDERDLLASRVEDLSQENKHLSDKLREVRNVDIKDKLKAGVVDEKDMDRLKKDFEDQEKILLATQEDNKRLVTQLRETEKELKEMKQSNKNPKRNLINTNPQVGNRDENQMRHHITELEIKLQNQQQLAQEREIELKDELQVQKKLRQDLENKLNQALAGKNQSENQMLRALEDQLREMERNHVHQVKELEEKVMWFVQNQQIVDRDEDIILEQRRTIQMLRDKIEELEQEKRKIREEQKKLSRNPADVKKIKELEQTIENIKKKKHDFNTLPELIKATKPSPEENEKIIMLTKQLKNVSAKLMEAEDTLSDDIDRRKRMKIQYETKIQALEEDVTLLQNKLNNQPKPAARIKELQTQLDEARTMHQKKTSELENQVRSLQSQLKRAESKTKSSPTEENNKPVINIDSSTKKIEALERELQQKDGTNELLSKKIELLEREIQQKDSIIYSLQERIAINSIPTMPLPPPTNMVDEQFALELQKENIKLTAQVEFLEEKLREEASKAAEQKISAQMIREAFKIEEEVKKLGEHEEVDVERARGVRQLRFLLNRVEELESKYRLKEMECARQLSEQQYKHEVELRITKQNFDLSLQEKSREVEKFKVALDKIRAGVLEVKRNNIQLQQRQLSSRGGGRTIPRQTSPNVTPPPQPQPQPERLFYSRPPITPQQQQQHQLQQLQHQYQQQQLQYQQQQQLQQRQQHQHQHQPK